MSEREAVKELYWYPLTTGNMASLRDNELVIKNFCPPLQPDKLIAIVCWNKTKRGLLDKHIFDNMRKGGISVANIGLTDEDLAYIEKGDFVHVAFSICTVSVASEETFKKLQEAKHNE